MNINKVATPEWLSSFSEKNLGTLWQVVKSYQSNKRQGTASTKTRGEVVSTGKKPYKQKKTGGARRGSFVSSLMVGGGVSFGPKPRDHREKVSASMAKVALGIALAKCIERGIVYEGPLAIASGKTRDANQLLKTFLPKYGKTVICLEDSHPSYANSFRALKNLRGVRLVPISSVNALDIVESRCVIFESALLDTLKTRVFGGAK